MKHRLARSGPTLTIHGNPPAPRLRRLGDEVEHPLRLVGSELGDLAERLDVALGDARAGASAAFGAMSRIATTPRRARDVVALADEVAEEAVGSACHDPFLRDRAAAHADELPDRRVDEPRE